MATVTKRRARRAAKQLERQHRAAIAGRNPLRTRGRHFDDPPFPNDPEGGAGVREPRRPLPTMPSGAIERELPDWEQVDLTRLAGR